MSDSVDEATTEDLIFWQSLAIEREIPESHLCSRISLS
jgi:hypothetical protein